MAQRATGANVVVICRSVCFALGIVCLCEPFEPENEIVWAGQAGPVDSGVAFSGCFHI